MNIQESYDLWSHQYDTNKNKTRDLEGEIFRKVLGDHTFNNVLEIGCGTGKNTGWLVSRANHITAVDLSDRMLAQARKKVRSDTVIFKQADIMEDWAFPDRKYDLISFSLVLEHIESLDLVFQKVSDSIAKGGYVYVGELHPFRQYKSSKARFETDKGTQVLTCFTHHISDFVQAALKYNFRVVDLNEHFDQGDRNKLPRIFSLLLKKT